MKRLIIILGLMVIVLITSSCSAFENPLDRDLTPEPAVNKAEQPEIQFPEVNSRDVELYIMHNEDGTSHVVNPYGTAAAEYQVDSNGNIIREDGTIAVKNGNTELYHETESLRFAEEEYRVSMDPLNLPVEYYYSGIYPNAAVPLRVSLEFDNADAANRVVLLESSNPQVISVCPNQNAGLIAHGAFQVPLGSVALQPDNPAEPMSITVSARNAGDATLTARAFTGDAVPPSRKNGLPVHAITPQHMSTHTARPLQLRRYGRKDIPCMSAMTADTATKGIMYQGCPDRSPSRQKPMYTVILKAP